MRPVLILALCLSIALGAVCGVHAHLERAVDGASGATVYSVHIEAELGPAHEADHEESGEIDISLLAMLVSSLAALAALWLLTAISGFEWFPRRSPAVRLRFTEPAFLPAIQRLIYYLHPPAHAPPFPAH
ncbi:MAG: hypothetical protein ABI645_00800 [Pseudomonadota bacterium]